MSRDPRTPLFRVHALLLTYGVAPHRASRLHNGNSCRTNTGNRLNNERMSTNETNSSNRFGSDDRSGSREQDTLDPTGSRCLRDDTAVELSVLFHAFHSR